MRILIASTALLFSQLVAAESNDSASKKDLEIYQAKFIKSRPKSLTSIDVIPLNSPVKETNARFLIVFPPSLNLVNFKYKIKSSSPRNDANGPYKEFSLVKSTIGWELQVPVKQFSPGFYQLYVKATDGNREVNYKTQYKEYAPFVIDQVLEVKLPDSKVNNATMLGVDSDKDGIRDDVQRWINEQFNNQPELKLSYKQYATAMQTLMGSDLKKDSTIPISHAILRSQNCIYEVGNSLGIDGKTLEVARGKIALMYLNTKPRIEARLKSSENFHGQEVVSLSKEEACSF